MRLDSAQRLANDAQFVSDAARFCFLGGHFFGIDVAASVPIGLFRRRLRVVTFSGAAAGLDAKRNWAAIAFALRSSNVPLRFACPIITAGSTKC